MDFFSFGSINNYMKTQDMQAKWQKKKSSGNFKADGITTMSKAMSKKQNDMQQAADIYNRSQENKDDKLTSIYSKIQNGAELTNDEMEYLKAKSPAAYQQVRKSQLEKESYKREIKQCRTKEDVQRLKMQHINQSVAEIKSVEHNPNISESDKLAVAYAQQRKMKDLTDVTDEFIRSGEYAKLSDEAEVNKSNEDMKQPEENEIKEISDNGYEENNKAADSLAGDRKDITRPDAETTEEVRKKRSRIKAAYTNIIETETQSQSYLYQKII